jgi:serine/threonine protein kinase
LLGKAGTPGYIPPEIYFNKPFTTKGDIFGLGVVLFSIVGGYSPFKGNTYHQIMEANRKADM